MWLQKLKNSLSKSGQKITAIKTLLATPDQASLDKIEQLLLSADVGVKISHQLIAKIKRQAADKSHPEMLELLYREMHTLIADCEQVLSIDNNASPFVLLVVGVNGSGKTTTAGKLAHYYAEQGYSVMLAAGDTFRAAAIEQIQVWGKRCDVPVVSQPLGADSGAVIYDAYQSAQAKKIDILIADTAGRMHTDGNLMEELKKIKRVLAKQNDDAPHETLLVIDANIGQNTLNQIKQFNQHICINGLVVTKLDGSAKGGVLFAMGAEFALPIRFIGIGEQADDLQVFHAKDYVAALLGEPAR